ncbi:MAG: serine/threonine protein phosphatase, partial [Oceanococcaceae bacterium]
MSSQNTQAQLSSAPDHEALIYAPDEPHPPVKKGWKLLIVDDEPEVHRVTELALDDFRFQERPLELIHVYSGAEAIRALDAQPDIALVLLDVVMETDHAGL